MIYKDLQKTNLKLIKKLNHYFNVNIIKINKQSFNDIDIEKTVQKTLKIIQQKNELKTELNETFNIIQRYFEQTFKIIVANRNFISLTVLTNLYVALI